MVVFWRRTDVDGLERLELTEGASGVRAASTVICVEHHGFRLDHTWELTHDWQTASLQIERVGADGRRSLRLDREGKNWRVNGQRRPDLDGAEEPDLSVTPFCNTLPIRRILNGANRTVTVDVAYVNGSDLVVTRSRHRYDRKERGHFHYADLGIFPGFEADLDVDERALVLRYQHLFERMEIRE